MKHFFKLLAIVVLSVIGAVGVGIGILYLSGGFEAKVVEPTNISFVDNNIMTYGPTDLKITTTTLDADPNCEVTLTTSPKNVLTVPSKVRLNQRFVVWPNIAADGENVGGKVTITASYSGKLVTECKLFIDVEVKSIKVSMENQNAKWGETVNFTTQVFPERALNPNSTESTPGVSWSGYGSKTIYYYLVDADNEPLDTKYAEFVVGANTVGSTITNKDIEEANAQGKAVAIKTKSSEETEPVTFYIKAYVYSTYSDEEKFGNLEEEEQLGKMILDSYSDPESPEYRDENHVTLTNFEIDGMQSSLASSDPDNLKVIEVYLYEETVFVADMKTTNASDLRKDLDISLYTDTPGADLSIIDFFIRDSVTLSIDNTSYFSFGPDKDAEGRYKARDGGETSDYWTWKLVWNTPDVSNYEALGKEFVITVQYKDSETIKFSFKIRVIARQSSSLTYETDTENDYFSVKSGEELKLLPTYFTVNPNDATFNLVKLYITGARNQVRYVPEETETTYLATFAFYKEFEKELDCAAINGADSITGLTYYSSPELTADTVITDITTYTGYVYARCEYNRGAGNASSVIPIRVYYISPVEDIKTHNMKFYAPSVIGYEETPFLKVNNILVKTDFDVQIDDYDNVYILIKSNDNRLVFENIGSLVVTAQVVYCDKDGRGIVNAFGEYIWTETSVSFDVEVYDEVSELSFFDSAITDTREGTDGIEGTTISATPTIEAENYVLKEDSTYYIYVKSPNSEALDLAVDGVDRANITIAPYFREELASKDYYQELTEINAAAITYSWERKIIGSEYGYRIKFMLDNCYKIEIEGGEVLDIIYKVEVVVDDCVLVGYFEVADNIVTSAVIGYEGDIIDKSNVTDDIETYVTSDDGDTVVLKTLSSVYDNDFGQVIPEGTVFDFNNLSFTLNMADGTPTIATMKYNIENLTKTASINGLVYFSDGKLVIENVPYVEEGVRIKVSISSEGFTGINSFYKLSGSTFIPAKEDATAEFTLIVHGLQISVVENDAAPISVRGIKLSEIELADETGPEINRLIFEIKDKKDTLLGIDAATVVDFVVYGGTSDRLYGVEGSTITIFDDISKASSLLVYLYVGDNTLAIDGNDSYTIFIDPIFTTEVIENKDTVDAPQIEAKITDEIVKVLREGADLSEYTNFYVEYVLDSDQEGYESVSKYVEFIRDGVNSYINVLNIPNDLSIDVELVIYEALGNKYSVVINDTTYTYAKGFFDGEYEFPVSNYKYDSISDGVDITFTESKAGATEENLTTMIKEYRLSYDDSSFVYDLTENKFLSNGYELPLRAYEFDEPSGKLYYKNSYYDVREVYSVTHNGTAYYYDEEEELLFAEDGSVPDTKDYLIDWDGMSVGFCDSELDVNYDMASGDFTVDISGIVYTYVEQKGDFYYSTTSLRSTIGYYYWNKSNGNWTKLYYIDPGTNSFPLVTTYIATKEGVDYTYNEPQGNFLNESSEPIENNIYWTPGDKKLYYTGANDYIDVGTYHVATYLGVEYVYVEGFFDEEGNELSSVVGAYTWSAADHELVYTDTEERRVEVFETENRKEIAKTNIVLNLHNIYTDSNLSLGQKFHAQIELNNGVHSFVFDGETYFYNQDTEEFMTSYGRAFTYEITKWENGVITYVNEADAEHTLNVFEDADGIKINYNGVDYLYSDTFVTNAETKFPYELTTDYIVNADAIVVKYHLKREELEIQWDGTNIYIEIGGYDATLNGKYIYNGDDNNPNFISASDKEFPFYIIPGYTPTTGNTLEYVMNRIEVRDDGGDKYIDYNGRTFKYNPGSGLFIDGMYIFGLEFDATNIEDGYITVVSEELTNGVNEAQLGFFYLFTKNGNKVATINGVDFIYKQNFYNLIGGAKFPAETVVDLDNNKVTFGGTTVDLLSAATYKYFTYGGQDYKYVPELIVSSDTDYPGEITSVDTSNIHNDINGIPAVGYVNGSIDLYEESPGVYYIKKDIIDDFSVKYYYKKVFLSTDGYKTEFEFVIDYNKTSLTDGGKLYYIDDTDATHTLDVIDGKLPLRYYITYDNGGGAANYYYDESLGDFINETEGSITNFVNITEYSLFDRTFAGTVVGVGDAYEVPILVENTYTSTSYIIGDSGEKYFFEASYDSGAHGVFDAFVLRNTLDPTVVEDVYKVESISMYTLTYTIPGTPLETFTTEIYKNASYDVVLYVVEVDTNTYFYNGEEFINIDTGVVFPYTIIYTDLVRNKLTYGDSDVTDILVYVPETYIEYEGTTYYYFNGLGEDTMIDRNGNKFAFDFSEDAINLESKEFSYVKYENHIVAGQTNGAIISLDGLYTVIVEGVRYRYNGSTFINTEDLGTFDGDILEIDLENCVLKYRDATGEHETHIYGKYTSFTVSFEDVEGVDYSTNTNAANHMRFNAATNTVYSYDLNCDKDVWVVVSVNFADGGNTVIKKRITIVQNLFMSMNDNVTFEVASNPRGMLLTNYSYYTDTIYRIDKYGNVTTLNASEYIVYDSYNTPTNEFSIADSCKDYASILISDDTPYLSPVNDRVSNNQIITIVYKYYIRTNNSGYYLAYNFDVKLIKK